MEDKERKGEREVRRYMVDTKRKEDKKEKELKGDQVQTRHKKKKRDKRNSTRLRGKRDP